MDGKSEDIKKDKIESMKGLFPEVFTEGKIDAEKLKFALGEDLNIQDERYVLNWAGKSEAFKVLQTQTTATLAPTPEESINFEKTHNVFIEGENLEVLKVLQKSYYGKIKMIYIDPPYNTGNDSFIYPDKFSESKDEYLKRIGDKDEEGFLLKEGLFRKNSKESGHYHSNWLSMMYPRLFLARNLMRDDGVIFVSIDDNEVHNLRMIMNEVFGEENFIGQIVWKKKTNGNNQGAIPPVHDFILSFSKNNSLLDEDNFGYPITKQYIDKNYSNPDKDLRGLWTTMDLSANHKGPHFKIINPNTGEEYFPADGRYWVFNEDEVQKRIKEGRIIFGRSGQSGPVQKVFLKEKQLRRIKPETWWDEHGMNEDGTKELSDLLGKVKVFSHSKPSMLIKNIVQISTSTSTGVSSDPDIILDFFAGSGTTAHAVLDLNKQDNGKRKFILVQLPEPCAVDSEAIKAGYKTIADICKDRIRRVIENIKDKKNLDLGFKVFKLKSSNFKIWRSDIAEDEKELTKQLDGFENPVKKEAEIDNMLWEILLKSGYDLNTKVENKKISDCQVFSVSAGELIVCLSKINVELIKGIVKQPPKKCICLDVLFSKNDQLKTNTVLQMKDAGVEFKTI